MQKIPSINLVDGYKVDHRRQYPKGTVKVVSNWTPRKSRVPGVESIVFFGTQYFIKKYLIEEYDKWFKLPEDVAVKKYERRINNYLGPKHGITFEHIAALHKLQYLPLEIKALPEGSVVPMRVPPLTIKNTLPEFYWLVNYLETLMSCTLWGPSTSATTAYQYKKSLRYWAMKTVGNADFVPFQGHDFSFRGMFGPEAAMMSGAGHLTSFVGTDTVPAIDWLEEYYGANSDVELVGCSVAATEHAVMCMGTGLYIYDQRKGDWSYQGEAEFELFKRLITEVYPEGIVSVVADTWNLWKVVTEYLPKMKDLILARNGRLVLRPDSSPKTPVEILCGDPDGMNYGYEQAHGEAAVKGLIEALWDIFGGTTTDRGYKLLDTHIGAIYGDSITMERQELICQGLSKKGFASINTVLGIGSYTYQCVTRDTYGWAMKATYGEAITSDGRLLEMAIFKDPITDDGTKKSAKGLPQVLGENGAYTLHDEATWEEEASGELEIIFLNSKLVKETTLSEIRNRIDSYMGFDYQTYKEGAILGA
jgi:nicotinamide phosphoribosyltransferase